jgi:hypothetical protein
MRPIVLAVWLCAVAGALTGFALARPTLVTVANAALFWAWMAVARSFWGKAARSCRACGAVDPLRLPDGSCAMCAAPVKKSGLAA